MIEQKVLQHLHNAGVIDKREIVWWQLGYEGRRILSEEEFSAGLKEVRVNIAYRCDGKRIEPRREIFRMWMPDTVPILLRSHEFDGMEMPFFISVKPVSHEFPKDPESYMRGLEEDGDYRLPPSQYLLPHIRGVAAHANERFLFWYPIKTGEDRSMTEVRGFDGMNIILEAIDSWKFCSNIIKDFWKVKRRKHNRAKKFETEKEGYEIVPFFGFDPSKKHLMVYPVQLRKRGLDAPVIVKSNPPHPPQALGVGYYYARKGCPAYYYPIDKSMQKTVRDTLRRDLEGICSINRNL
jgi:hypothetical protein